MAPPKLPAERKSIHRSVSLLPAEWDALRMIGRVRRPRMSVSGMVREAVLEYIERRLGSLQPADEGAA